MNNHEIIEKIYELIEKYYSDQKSVFVPGKTKIPIAAPAFGSEEVKEALHSLLTNWVTMGSKVKEFEKKFAKYIGVKHAIMVNSGSSANFLTFAILTNQKLKSRLKSDDEVLTPALTWATTVYPLIQNGLKPVFLDVNLESFNIDVEKIEESITEKTKAIFPVHLLGNPANMREIKKIAEKNDLLLVEDSCEAHGAEWEGQKVGSFGDLSTFSFFVSHHITTMEGGMILTNNDEFFEIGKSLRTFGWIRDLEDRTKISSKFSNIDPRYLFYNIGFNFRPTELQGGFGIHQIEKLEKFIEIRRSNAEYWNKTLSQFSDYLKLPTEISGNRHVYYSYPILVTTDAPFTCKQLMDFLESQKIEVRPIMSGNMVEQPSAELYSFRIAGNLKNSNLIMKNAFFIGTHQKIGKEEREFITNSISGFITEKKWIS